MRKKSEGRKGGRKRKEDEEDELRKEEKWRKIRKKSVKEKRCGMKGKEDTICAGSSGDDFCGLLELSVAAAPTEPTVDVVHNIGGCRGARTRLLVLGGCGGGLFCTLGCCDRAAPPCFLLRDVAVLLRCRGGPRHYTLHLRGPQDVPQPCRGCAERVQNTHPLVKGPPVAAGRGGTAVVHGTAAAAVVAGDGGGARVGDDTIFVFVGRRRRLEVPGGVREKDGLFVEEEVEAARQQAVGGVAEEAFHPLVPVAHLPQAEGREFLGIFQYKTFSQ